MSFFHSNTYKKTLLPLFIAFAAFIFTVIITELEFVRNFEFQITDTAKFRVKTHIEKNQQEIVDSEIMILGINEESGSKYLNKLFGPFPWPRDVYAEFLSYFNLDLPSRFKFDRIASILDSLPGEQSAKIITFINTNYIQSDQVFKKVKKLMKTANLGGQKEGFAKNVYDAVLANLNKDFREFTLKKELMDDKSKRAEKAQEWFQLVYNMNLNELKALTWNSITPQMVFFDIFLDLPRNTIRDQFLFDELKSQKDKNYLFIDFYTGNLKKDRLLLEGTNLKERIKLLKNWEIKNIYDDQGNRVIPDQEAPLSIDVKPPLLNVLKNMTGIGPANIIDDKDGKIRKMPLIWKVYDERLMYRPAYIPTIDLTLVLNKFYTIKKSSDFKNIIQNNVKVELGKAITLKDVIIRKRIHYVRTGFQQKAIQQNISPVEEMKEQAGSSESTAIGSSKEDKEAGNKEISTDKPVKEKSQKIKKKQKPGQGDTDKNDHTKEQKQDEPNVEDRGNSEDKNLRTNSPIDKSSENQIKKYRWTEFVDPFMDLIIERLIKKVEEKNQAELNYNKVIEELMKDSKLKEELQKKYRKNKLNLEITDYIFKKEIADFLNSLTETSVSKRSDFFIVESQKFDQLNLSKLKDYYTQINQEYKILNHIVKQKDDKSNDSEKKGIRFLGGIEGKKVFKGVSFVKEELLKTANMKETELNSLIDLLKRNKLITNFSEKPLSSFVTKILDKSGLKKLIKKEKDIKIKDTADYFISWVENLSDGTSGIDDFYQELKNQFDVDQKMAKRILDDLKEKKIIDYSVINITNIKLDIPDLHALNTFASIPGQFEASIFESELISKITDKEKKDFILSVYSKHENVYKIKDNLTSMDNLRIAEVLISIHYASVRLYSQNIGSIVALINFAHTSERNGTPVYYTLAKSKVINYLKEKSKLSEEDIYKALGRKTIEESAKIILDKEIIKISSPDAVSEASNKAFITSLIIDEIINSLQDNKNGKLYYRTILTILDNLEKHKDIKINIFQLEEQLDEIKDKIAEQSNKIMVYTLSPIPEDKRKIHIKSNILQTYRIQVKDIVIPIDQFGRITINFQGEDRSYEHPPFGKYMMFSRGLPHPVTGTITPFRWEYFKNKMVCIGINTSAGLGEGKDYFATPYGKLYGIEIHANALYTLFEQEFIHSLPNVLFRVSGLKILAIDSYQPTIWTILLIPLIIGLLVGIFYYFVINNDKLTAVKAGAIGMVAVFFIPSLLDVINNGFTMSHVSGINMSLAIILGLALPRISILRGFLFFFIILLLYIAFNIFYIFPNQRLDIPLIGGILTIGFTFIGLTIYKLVTEEKEKRKIKGMFSKYVSPDLVHQLINTSKKLELGGEDRTLTVLFSDIRGFTKLSEGLDPQALVSHLNEYYTEMTRILQEFKGTLDKYIGDAIMAFWGAPLDIPNHALLACKASLEMMEQLDEMNTNWPPEMNIHIGIGLNSGNMIVGNMGSSNRMDYTIMGDNVNLGSRVEGANKMYTTEIIITEYTYEMVKDMVICRELDLIRVKGKEKPVKIYELLGINE